jgi:Golgi phosphoprotein 3
MGGTDDVLTLPEEILLLMLRDEQGTMRSYAQGVCALGAAILRELVDAGRLLLVPDKKKLFVELRTDATTRDPLLDECLDLVAKASRRAQVGTWISRFAGRKQLGHRLARRLVQRGILRAEERTILLFFRQRVYPELDPRPEGAVRERLRKAIFCPGAPVDPRTLRLLSLADSVDLLPAVFPRKELRAQRKRIRTLVAEEPLGAAVRKILAERAAAVVAGTTAAAG